MSGPAGDLRSRVRGAAAWSAVNNLVLRLGSLALGIVLARLLTPGEFGAYAVALMVQAVLMTLADLGLSADLIRSDEPHRRAPAVGALGLGTGVLMCVGMAASAPAVATLLGSPGSTHAIQVLSLTLVLAGAGVVPYAWLQRRFDQRSLLVVGVVDLVVSTTVTIGLVLAGWGVMALAVGRVVAQAVTLVLQFRLARTRPAYRFDRAASRSVLRFGVPVALANMLSWALLNVDTVVIARTVGPVALGFYVLAFNMSSWPMTAIGQVVRSVALPGFARLSADERGEALVRGAALTWALALPAGAALAVLASPLVTFVYGGRWSPAAPVLLALGLFGALRVVFDLAVAFLLAVGASPSVLGVQLLWFAALVPAAVVGAREAGIRGVGAAHLAVSALVVLPVYLVLLRRHGVRLPALVAGTARPLAAVVPAAGIGLVAAREIGSPGLAVLVGGAGGAACYALLVGRWVRRLLAAAPAPGAGATPAPVATTGHPADLPTVSVVVPCHDYVDYVGDAVRSALDQRGVVVQVVVVDDASTDGSAELVRALAVDDERVTLLVHAENRGPVETFNDGLALVTGEYVVRLDADDLLTPGSLARSAAVCTALPGVGLVYGRPVHFAGRPPSPGGGRPRWRVWSGGAWLEELCRSGVNVITSPEAFMRTSVVRRIGGQRPLTHTHDMEMWMRMATVCDVAHIGGPAQAWHREHPASLSVTSETALGTRMLEERLDAFRTLAAGPAGDHAQPGLARLGLVGGRALALEAVERACWEYDRGRAPARGIGALRSFAVRAWPEVVDDPRWAALDARIAAGAGWRTRRPWLVVRPVARRARDRLRHRRWSRTGLYRPLAGVDLDPAAVPAVPVVPAARAHDPHDPHDPHDSAAADDLQLEGTAS